MSSYDVTCPQCHQTASDPSWRRGPLGWEHRCPGTHPQVGHMPVDGTDEIRTGCTLVETAVITKDPDYPCPACGGPLAAAGCSDYCQRCFLFRRVWRCIHCGEAYCFACAEAERNIGTQPSAARDMAPPRSADPAVAAIVRAALVEQPSPQYGTGPFAIDVAAQVLRARADVGAMTYGDRLHLDDVGRDPMADTLQECADALTYAVQARAQWDRMTGLLRVAQPWVEERRDRATDAGERYALSRWLAEAAEWTEEG